ncbi:MAG: peptidoglycan-binding protein [Beutenbergiaceae bacterium]
MPSRFRLPATLVCAVAMLLAWVAPASASFGGDVVSLVNQARAGAGLSALSTNAAMNSVAQAWAEHLSRTRSLGHNPSYSQQIPADWSMAAENVAQNPSPTPAAMHQQLMDSSGHRVNIMGNYSHIGIGYATDSSGGGWLVQVFALYINGPGTVPGPPPEPSLPPTTAPPAPAPSPPAPAPSGAAPSPGQGRAPTPVPTTGNLGPGSSGEGVRTVQENLIALGFDLDADGVYGDQTEAAVRQFQTDAGLEADGRVGPATAQALNEAVAAANETPVEEPSDEELNPSESATPSTSADGTRSPTVTPDLIPSPVAEASGPATTHLIPTSALVGTLGVSSLAFCGLLLLRRRLLLQAGNAEEASPDKPTSSSPYGRDRS